MKTDIEEKELHPMSGGVALLLLILGIACGTALFAEGVALLIRGGRIVPEWQAAGDEMVLNNSYWTKALGVAFMLVGGIGGWLVCSVMMAGLKIVKPNEARVFTLFGKYYGTIKASGFYFVNPFVTSFSPAYNEALKDAQDKARQLRAEGKIARASVPGGKGISLKTQTLDNRRQKVNDVLGNPIVIGAVVIWHVENPTKAAFAVENYMEFLNIQTDATIRNIARLYPYDVFDEDDNDDGVKEKTLRGSAMEIADTMRDELQKHVGGAGLTVEEVCITHLAYAEEIAAAMLQRQQATAIIAARQKIVDGAVGMVKMALDRLNEDEVVELDEERKAAMVSNLLVILCSNREVQPVVNSGSIYG